MISDKIELEGFSRYLVELEGSQLSSRDESVKQLTLEIGLDGSIIIKIEKVAEENTETMVKRLLNLLPPGYELYHITDSAKIIKGVRGKYYHFKHKVKSDYISFNIGAGGKPYKIVLGSLYDVNSKIRIVLENIPNGPFKKADMVHVLPQSIVENRQPIKAALDILEKEGYVRKISADSVSEQYVRTDKPIPQTKLSRIE
ncbi:MAG: hypothetical protein KatS3mg003_0781 [Candidatus Nitrosocaldaceae archaeon]|nr:MAG: hypothetical protein KatS3mg003_0781 [Candidatus Nitrosocaldaceae archaeon]